MTTHRKRGILGRLYIRNSKIKTNNEVTIIKPTNVDHPSTQDDDLNKSVNSHENQPSRTSSISSESLSSFTSSVSSVTVMTSDRMKCLNNLRIQETPLEANFTPSVASIPRLAPPPESARSMQPFATWPRRNDKLNEKIKLSGMDLCKTGAGRFQSVTSSSSWVAVFPEVKYESKRTQSTPCNRQSVYKTNACFHSNQSQTMESKIDQDSNEEVSSEKDSRLKSASEKYWTDSSTEGTSNNIGISPAVQISPFARASVQESVDEGLCKTTLLKESLDVVLRKNGTSMIELVETVDVHFLQNKMTEYVIRGEVRFKLSPGSRIQNERLAPEAVSCLEAFHFILKLECISQNVYFKNIMIKKNLMIWNKDDELQGHRRSLDSTINKRGKGIVESKTMQWNLAKCFQEALTSPVTLMKYTAQPSGLCSPPLNVQIHWQKSKEPEMPIIVNVIVDPNRKLSSSLWGVRICLKGFGTDQSTSQFHFKEASTSPPAKWNPNDCSFEWCISVINPGDSASHLKVKINQRQGEILDRDLSASVQFVMPHATPSGTNVLSWIEAKSQTKSDVGSNEDKSQSSDSANEFTGSTIFKSDFISCERVCLSGHYETCIK
eukprot:g7925.t1